MTTHARSEGVTRLLLLGATGHVGQHVLRQALSDPRIGSVVAPVRRVIPPHRKLIAPTMSDFDALDETASWWEVDAVICALGTTLSTAGSKAQFRKVDHDYPLSFARIARAKGAQAFVLNSAIGANSRSRFFYNRVKGELEDDLSTLGFGSLTYVRPGVIGGDREEFRLTERALVKGLRLVGPVLPKRFRLNPPQKIAQCLLNATVTRHPGAHIVTSDLMA